LKFTFINLAGIFIQTKYTFGELHLQMSCKCKKAIISVYETISACIIYSYFLKMFDLDNIVLKK